MKLAEALILRADSQKRIAQLKSRLLTNAKVQEGDKPAETPQDLVTELGSVSNELLDLIKRINRTNSATVFARGTISDALAERDVLAPLPKSPWRTTTVSSTAGGRSARTQSAARRRCSVRVPERGTRMRSPAARQSTEHRNAAQCSVVGWL